MGRVLSLQGLRKEARKDGSNEETHMAEEEAGLGHHAEREHVCVHQWWGRRRSESPTPPPKKNLPLVSSSCTATLCEAFGLPLRFSLCSFVFLDLYVLTPLLCSFFLPSVPLFLVRACVSFFFSHALRWFLFAAHQRCVIKNVLRIRVTRRVRVYIYIYI